MDQLTADARFLRAIAVGAVVGVPVAWLVMVVVFLLTTDAGFVEVAGYSLLPAIVCGPFLGGLITTSRLSEDEPAPVQPASTTPAAPPAPAPAIPLGAAAPVDRDEEAAASVAS
jgi:hypothetical protein